MLKNVEICNECHKLIRLRKKHEQIYLYKTDKYRRCSDAEDNNCKFILCDAKYPWYKNNKWFGVFSRALDNWDYQCPDCGDTSKNEYNSI